MHSRKFSYIIMVNVRDSKYMGNEEKLSSPLTLVMFDRKKSLKLGAWYVFVKYIRGKSTMIILT